MATRQKCFSCGFRGVSFPCAAPRCEHGTDADILEVYNTAGIKERYERSIVCGHFDFIGERAWYEWRRV
jgi:hypothetical protein